jgi:integrase/recombinase XerD
VSDLAPILQGFFTDRLARQKKASPNTVAAYRDTCRLLLSFAQDKTGRAPSRLSIADLDAALIGAFLHHLEDQRGNSSATRNARLAAIHSLFRYAAPRAPEHAAVISQVLAIPPGRRERAIVSYLTPEETDALLATPDRGTWHGRHDHALLLLAVQTGLRVSELTGLTRQDAHLGAGPHVRCHGKGRKDRATPLTSQTVKVLKTWLAECGPSPDGPLFPTRAGGRLSRDAVERLVAKHAAAAAARLPVHQGEERHPAHAQAHRSHVAAAGRGGHLGHRPLARSRGRGNHPGLPPRRHDHQGTGPRPRPATGNQPRTLPSARQPPRVPRQPLTTVRGHRVMPIQERRTNR